MTDQSNATNTAAAPAVANDETEQASRRKFLGMTGATVLAVPALLTAHRASAAPGEGVAGPTEIARPARLGPRAMLDSRFPASFAGVPKATEVMIGYFTALSARDVPGMAKYLHFPFASFEGLDPVRVDTAASFLKDPPASMDMNLNPRRFTDQDGYMQEGAYDLFRGLEVVASDPVNVVFAMNYDRCNRNGKPLLRCEGIYAVTNNDGRWAIQLMSTIFTPADLIGIDYPDAVTAAFRSRIDHDLAYQVQDLRYDHPPQEGARASVRNSGPGAPFWVGPEGRIMENYRIKGVTSRLSYLTPDAPRTGQVQQGVADGGSGSVKPGNRGVEAYMGEYRKLFPTAGLPDWGWVSGISKHSRVIHQSAAKVHIFGGAERYSTAGEFLNSNFDVRVMTYKDGFWGTAGSFIYMSPHDRSNDLAPPQG